MVNARSRRSRLIRLSWAALFTVGFLALYWVSNLTVTGQTAENSLLGDYGDQTLAFWLYNHAGLPPFAHGAETAIAGVVLVAVIAASRRRWRELAIVTIATPVAILAANVFKSAAGRPGLVNSPNHEPSFPSGHFAVAAAITLALLIVVPRVWLRWCAPVVLAWTVITGAGVQSMGWHRPSDILGSALLVAAVFLVVASLFSKSIDSVGLRQLWPGPAAAIITVAIIAVAIAVAWKSTLWIVPYLAITALLSAVVIGWVALKLCRTAAR